jgi:uncharacterized protein (TIGR02217 family)
MAEDIIDDIFLPEEIEKGARGSAARFNTTVFTSASGAEYRTPNWDRQVGRWTITFGYRYTDDEDYEKVINMFYAAKGRAFGFLFKDWSDYKCTNAVYQDGVYYKPYGNGIRTYLRKITRIKPGTLVGSGNGASFEFYVPVRFDTDALDIEIETDGLANIPALDLVEIIE